MKNKKPFSGKPSILDLPSTIMYDILSLQPTKTILSCKLVCKLWCSIIKDPHFHKSSKSITMIVRRIGDGRVNKNLLLVEPEIDYAVRKRNGNLCIMLGNKADIKFKNGWFDGIPVKNLEIVNLCMGLVCLSLEWHNSPGHKKKKTYDWAFDPFIVCNPVASDYVVVKYPISTEMRHSYGLRRAGFGFSSENDQYKVLRVFEKPAKSDDDGSSLMAEVCTLGSGEEWRDIENCLPQGFFWSKKGIFFKGTLHWIIWNIWNTDGSIVAFEWQHEIFILMDVPGFYNEDIGWKIKELAILHSQLCFCISTVEKKQYDIWAMNEYGVKESWRKLFVISVAESDTINHHMPFKPLACWNNGEILMLSMFGELVSYDVKSNTWRAIKIAGVTEKVEVMLLDPVFLPTKKLLMQGKQPKMKNH